MIDKFQSLFKFFEENTKKSYSQCLQDLFVVFFTNYIGKVGYFVEIGAADGKHFSNTFLLEALGWRGILVDPVDYDSKNIELRKSFKDKRCVYSKSGLKLKFTELIMDEMLGPGQRVSKEFSGLTSHLSDYAKTIKTKKNYDVATVSLNDLLDEYNAPNKIDYISIDTEGSEFEILSTFNFNKYDVEIFTIEHNLQSYREDIFKLLESKKYFRIPPGMFTPGFEDWYIKKDNIVLKKIGV